MDPEMTKEAIKEMMERKLATGILRNRKMRSKEMVSSEEEEGKMEVKVSKDMDDVAKEEIIESKKLQVLKEKRQIWESSYEKWNKRKEKTYTKLFGVLGIYATVVVGIATLQMHLTWLDCVVPTILVGVGWIGFSVIVNLDSKLTLLLRILDKKMADKKMIIQEWERLQRLGEQDTEMEDWCKDDQEDEISSAYGKRLTSVVAFFIFLWVVFVTGRCWLDYCKIIH